LAEPRRDDDRARRGIAAIALGGSMSLPELYQFSVSHFNEKARWALDYKKVEHVRHSLLPGPHKVKIKRMTGQEQVPVLRDAGRIVAGSAEIIDHLERQNGAAALYPADPATRERALAIQRRFDDEVGPAIRLAMFHELLEDQAYFVRMFTWDQPWLARTGYRAMFPLVKVLMSKEMRLTAENAEKARAVTKDAFDFVARESAGSGYLAGDSFSVADLAAASLLAPGVEFERSPFRYPEPYSPVLRKWWARWGDHSGAEWVRTMFARHR
jgi:glutathione S-transferase